MFTINNSMSEFTKPFSKPLMVTYVRESKNKAIWEITESFRYYVSYLHSEEFIDVPVGFQTDFASIPRPLWSIFPPTGKYIKAAVIHDYLIDNKGVVKINDSYTSYSKKRVDEIFLEAMEVLGVSKMTRKIMYYSVRAFGNKF
jgi:hypothetical protein